MDKVGALPAVDTVDTFVDTLDEKQGELLGMEFSSSHAVSPINTS
jgi:hypothetical protein